MNDPIVIGTLVAQMLVTALGTNWADGLPPSIMVLPDSTRLQGQAALRWLGEHTDVVVFEATLLDSVMVVTRRPADTEEAGIVAERVAMIRSSLRRIAGEDYVKGMIEVVGSNTSNVVPVSVAIAWLETTFSPACIVLLERNPGKAAMPLLARLRIRRS